MNYRLINKRKKRKITLNSKKKYKNKNKNNKRYKNKPTEIPYKTTMDNNNNLM